MANVLIFLNVARAFFGVVENPNLEAYSKNKSGRFAKSVFGSLGVHGQGF